MEAFNKNIIQKIRYLKLENKNNFDTSEAIDKAVNIYNNTLHSTIKIDPIKAFYLRNKKILNRILQNILNSQINEKKDSSIIEKGSKAL